MATVLQRFERLGLAHNNKILMLAGIHVANAFIEKGYTFQNPMLQKVPQKEDENVFYVWDYPEFWNKEMDHAIIHFLEHYLEEAKKEGVNG